MSLKSGGVPDCSCFETRGDEEMHGETQSGPRGTSGVRWRGRKCKVVYGCSVCVRFGLNKGFNKAFNKGITRDLTREYKEQDI